MNKILLIINKLIKRILNNKKFVNFSIILILFFITFILTNTRSKFIQTLIILTKLCSIKILLLLFILFTSYYNFSLGLLYLISIIILMNIPSYIEGFSNIPNLVDKKKILEFNKNFKNPKQLTEEKGDIKKINNNENEEKKIDDNSEKQEIKKKIKKVSTISQDYNEEIKNNVEEVNLDEKEDTIENELKKKYTNEYKKLEEFESSSSESSNSESSESSTDSSDSDKELDDVSMDVARNHMLNKLRSGLKKKYLND